MGEVTELLAAIRNGEPGALDRVVAVTYRELHALAHQRLRLSGRGDFLDTTSLVHECYLRLVRVGALQVEERENFLAYAASVMRSIVIDFARRGAAVRRGGAADHVTLDTGVHDGDGQARDELVRLDAALTELSQVDARLAKIVELRYFAGLTNDEIARILGVTERTVRRDWQKARLLLHRELVP
jgi:RNA polymerase sigma factor (TIGR02999 family)